jgi:hypothetical protein
MTTTAMVAATTTMQLPWPQQLDDDDGHAMLHESI